MPVRYEKNAYDPPDAKRDGVRIVATRYWPRGLKREAADLYLPDLAPSTELLHAFRDEEITWQAFAKRYREEMKGQTSHLRTLNWLSERAGRRLTVLCTCETAERCHRRLLAGLIEKAG
ncbi:MAG: hypothetical protein TEF_19425 [Rhizobiales bacterium NRL2]|jgi:uncharacterized protein YeaO (DUF488 family)|nr:MAG: hypothetical protein TEF_19425 [Rhizobiales bacterium NRL2]